ncbi:trehalose-phosphatase [Angustibacter luteus]|uniref:Trehalose 6-phosphate phosphatase n=1 Tax=Angustibacter luteus TaxID=658456 RepID=A0ABW1JDM5_9ACTN
MSALDGPDPLLQQALTDLGRGRPLLVGLDFDGVLAPFVPHPSEAVALPGTMDAIRDLVALEGVYVALVSGRARADLAERTGVALDDEHLLLVGSHGAELPLDGHDDGLDDAEHERLSAVQARLETLAAEHPGAFVEHKPSAAVLHTRRLPPDEAPVVTAQALALMADVPDVHVTRGKEVVEVAVTQASKGAAISRLRDHHSAVGALYVGDDVTDETVFVLLGEGDVGVKVGDGDTAARFRIADPVAVRSLLQSLPNLLLR